MVAEVLLTNAELRARNLSKMLAEASGTTMSAIDAFEVLLARERRKRVDLQKKLAVQKEKIQALVRLIMRPSSSRGCLVQVDCSDQSR